MSMSFERLTRDTRICEYSTNNTQFVVHQLLTVAYQLTLVQTVNEVLCGLKTLIMFPKLKLLQIIHKDV